MSELFGWKLVTGSKTKKNELKDTKMLQRTAELVNDSLHGGCLERPL